MNICSKLKVSASKSATSPSCKPLAVINDKDTRTEMSHLHQNHYKDNKQLIAYINGFLWTLEILNDEVNHGQTYYVEEIERLDNYEESIKKHLFDQNYVITLKEILDWKVELQLTSISFFESILNKIELNDYQKEYSTKYNRTKRDTTNFTLINEKYISLMNELIVDNSKFYEVLVNWDKGSFYECYHKDYLVDNEKGLFFVHFGTSD
jgi:hypothetical protein